MTFVITSPCLGTQDRACVDACPVDCIHFEAGVDAMLYINPIDCIDCGACQPACPVSAIFPESEVSTEESRFIRINSLWFDDAPAARVELGTDIEPVVSAEEVAGSGSGSGSDDGVADEEDDGVDFHERLTELNNELNSLNAAAGELESQITNNISCLLR